MKTLLAALLFVFSTSAMAQPLPRCWRRWLPGLGCSQGRDLLVSLEPSL